MRLTAKVAIVTGGGSGIGAGVCLAFARNGADVCVAGVNLANVREVANEVEALGRKALAVQVDVSKSPDVDFMVEATTKEFGKIDVLVNCAGVRYVTTLLEHPEDVWDKTLAINLKGTFLCTQRVARAMVRQGIRGSIINIGSSGAKMCTPDRAAYLASKGAVVTFTKAAAMELGAHGIRINVINPGLILTPIHRDNMGTIRRFLPTVPIGRAGEPEDIAMAAVYLASDESTYATGATFDIDGGLTTGYWPLGQSDQ